jgi:cellulose synthase/poly-beta-1,6-N-acetylglucosamine synthase-like glycosyltransferase
MNEFFAILSVLLVPLLLVYAGYLLFYFRGFSLLTGGRNVSTPSVTVIIPARNEEKNIRRCLESLVRQDYPKELFEIIVVDDGSSDGTAGIVEEFSGSHSHRITCLPLKTRSTRISPKINALSAGIEISTGDILATTDADCTVSENWISSLAAHFEETVGVVTGTTVYAKSESLSRLFLGIQFLDFISYTAVGAGSIGQDTVSTCNGSNMAFRRKAFNDIGGFDSFSHLNTGDDSLLGQKITASKKWKAKFIVDPFSSVTTQPAASWKEFFSQRMRWAGQTTEYPAGTLIFMINTFLLYILLFISIPASIVTGTIVPIGVWIVKSAADYSIMRKFCRLTKTEEALRYFLPTALIHIPVILYSVFGGFFGRFTWKDRTIGRTAE